MIIYIYIYFHSWIRDTSLALHNLVRSEVLLEIGFIIIIIIIFVGLKIKRLLRSFNFRRRFSIRRATKLAFFLIVVLKSACKRQSRF